MPVRRSLRFPTCCIPSFGRFHCRLLAGFNITPRRSIIIRRLSVISTFFLRAVEYVALLIRQRHSCAIVGSHVRFSVRSLVNFESAVNYTLYFIFGRIHFRFFVPTSIRLPVPFQQFRSQSGADPRLFVFASNWHRTRCISITLNKSLRSVPAFHYHFTRSQITLFQRASSAGPVQLLILNCACD